MTPQFRRNSLMVLVLICLMSALPMASGVSGGDMLSAVCNSLFNLGYNRL